MVFLGVGESGVLVKRGSSGVKVALRIPHKVRILNKSIVLYNKYGHLQKPPSASGRVSPTRSITYRL